VDQFGGVVDAEQGQFFVAKFSAAVWNWMRRERASLRDFMRNKEMKRE
jgi:hypothetical protein